LGDLKRRKAPDDTIGLLKLTGAKHSERWDEYGNC